MNNLSQFDSFGFLLTVFCHIVDPMLECLYFYISSVGASLFAKTPVLLDIYKYIVSAGPVVFAKSLGVLMILILFLVRSARQSK